MSKSNRISQQSYTTYFQPSVYSVGIQPLHQDSWDVDPYAEHGSYSMQPSQGRLIYPITNDYGAISRDKWEDLAKKAQAAWFDGWSYTTAQQVVNHALLWGGSPAEIPLTTEEVQLKAAIAFFLVACAQGWDHTVRVRFGRTGEALIEKALAFSSIDSSNEVEVQQAAYTNSRLLLSAVEQAGIPAKVNFAELKKVMAWLNFGLGGLTSDQVKNGQQLRFDASTTGRALDLTRQRGQEVKDVANKANELIDTGVALVEDNVKSVVCPTVPYLGLRAVGCEDEFRKRTAIYAGIGIASFMGLFLLRKLLR